MRNLFSVDAWKMKLILIFLMLLTHLQYVHNLLSPEWNRFFEIVSRGVAPMFGYLMVEGIFYTRSLKKYCLRMIIWAVIVTTGNWILSSILIKLSPDIPADKLIYLKIRTNITFTLVMGLVCISFVKYSQNISDRKKKTVGYLISALTFLIGFIIEWGVVLLPFMLFTYLTKNKKNERLIAYILIECIAIFFRSEIYYFLVFPFIYLYNGKRGMNGAFNKYFFYFFYPLHLWIIAIANFYILNQSFK